MSHHYSQTLYIFAMAPLYFVLTYWFCPHCWIVSGLAFHCPSFCHNYTVSHLCHLLAEMRYSLSLCFSFSKCVCFFFPKQNQTLPSAHLSKSLLAPSNIPETPFLLLQRLTVIPIMKKYVQEMGDCHRSCGNFILINLGQKLAAWASWHSSRLPEVDPIFCLNRH